MQSFPNQRDGLLRICRLLIFLFFLILLDFLSLLNINLTDDTYSKILFVFLNINPLTEIFFFKWDIIYLDINK
jgi:hypothetical protein